MPLCATPKPALTLIHGWGLGASVWQPVLPALAQRLTLHLASLPGYRWSEYREKQQSTDQGIDDPHKQLIAGHIVCSSPFHAACSEDCFASTDFIQMADSLAATLPENSFVAGWSLGGLLALQVALRTPQRVKGLILIGSTPRFTQRDGWPHAQPSGLLDTFSQSLAKEPTEALQRFIALLNQGDRHARRNTRIMSQAFLATLPPDNATLLTGLGWLRDVDLCAQIGQLTLPTLLIHGENDPLIPLAAARWLHQRLPDSQLHVIHGAAHAPFINDPESFAKRIGDFCHADLIH